MAALNIPTSYLTGRDVYAAYLDGDRSYWDSMSDKKRAKWEAMAAWIDSRATHTVDVSELLDEIMTRQGKAPIPFARHEADPDDVGMDVHDDDIAASAQRFLAGVDEDVLERLKIKPRRRRGPEPDFVSDLKAAGVSRALFGDNKLMSKEQHDLLTQLKAEEMAPDAPVKPTAVEVIDALAEMLKRLLGMMELPDNALWPKLGYGFMLSCRQHVVDDGKGNHHPKVTVYIAEGAPDDQELHRRRMAAILHGELPPNTIAHHTLDVGMYGTQANVLETMRMLKERVGL